MKRIFDLLAAEAKPDETPGAENWPEAAPVKKRGLFMTPKIFGGKDADAAPTPEPNTSKGNEAPDPPAPTPMKAEEVSPILPPPAAGTPDQPPAKSDTLAGAVEAAAQPATPTASLVSAPTPGTVPAAGGGQASAQLTFGFEVASMQLSPFFKLASMRLKAISNVVSLHLVAGQTAGEPLAAGISFQIERVDLDEASRLKGLLLKPLGDARKLAAPASELRVEGLSLGGDEGSPIALTTAAGAPTTVHLFGTFTITGMEFTPSFEIGALQLAATSNLAFVSVNPASHPAAGTPPPAFEIREVEVDGGRQLVSISVGAGPAGRA